ncbi:MAG: methyltransferase domain-containing protein [Myxococcales bacterium]|nr:MAG: methyltransferase domain-containing protein [Myxococcales bacterium]
MTDPPHVARVREQFTRQAEAYAGMQQTRDEAGMRLLVALAGAKTQSRVLDVACGPGFLTLAFAGACASARGIDATPAFVERARHLAQERGIGNVSFAVGDANALPEPDASWDIVACRAAFHHFPDPTRVLAEMARAAKPGGTLLVADLLGSELPECAALHDRIERLCDPTHARALPLSEFSALFRAQGVEVASQFGSEMHYDVEEWLAHGGPDPDAAAEIRSLLEASIEGDRADLAVQRAEGRLRFRHRTAAFVLRTPLA